MKVRILYQQIYQAEQKCSKSKRKGSQCQRFGAGLIDNLFEIQQVLQSKTYVPKPMRVFIADNGSKPREIYAPHYFDRVIHHLLVPKLEKIISHKFIHDSTANQKNKGTHFAVARLQKMMRRYEYDESPKIHRSGIPLWVPAISAKHKNDDIYNQFNSKQEIQNKPKKRHPQGDTTTEKIKKVVWAKHAQPNTIASDNSIVGLHCVQRQPTVINHIDKTEPDNSTYYLQLDIHNFFYSIDKNILIQILVNHIKIAIKQKKITRDTGKDYYWLCQQILKRNNKGQITHNIELPFIKQLHNIDSYKGLPIGNLTSQFFGNVYLNELDQFVKHQLKVKHYVRYVDDFVLLSDSPQQLEKWQSKIQQFLDEKLSLRLKEVVKPKDITHGVDFLGYIIRPHYNLVRRRILGNMYQRLSQWYKENSQKVKNGVTIHLSQAPSDKIDSVFASYIGHFKQAKSQKIIMQKFKQFKWLSLLFYQHGNEFKSKRHTKKANKLTQQWNYFRFHYQPFVSLMQVGCYFVVLKHSIASLFGSMHSHAEHGNERRSTPSMRGGATRHQTTGLPFCHAKRPEGLGAGAERQSPQNIFKQSKLKPKWCECHQANLPKVLKNLQSNSISYVVVTQQGYVNNKLRKRKVSQIYISNNFKYKESI